MNPYSPAIVPVGAVKSELAPICRHLHGHRANFQAGGIMMPLCRMEAIRPRVTPAGTISTGQVAPLLCAGLRRCDPDNRRILHPACACRLFYPSATRDFQSGTQRHYFSWGLFAMDMNAPGDMLPGELPSGAQPHI